MAAENNIVPLKKSIQGEDLDCVNDLSSIFQERPIIYLD